MKYFSMFSGIGGFEYGIGTEGECVGFSEIDKYASSVYKYHFPKHKEWGNARDISTEGRDGLPDFDLLVGGFPCQAFSIAGKRRGFSDTRGTLFFEIARILQAKRPSYFLLENVKGILSHEEGKTFKTIITTLNELGYNTQWMVLNSKFFGVPQNRERVFFIGSLRGTDRPEILPFRENGKSINDSTSQFSREVQTETTNCITARYHKMAPTDTYIQYARKDKTQHSRVYSTEGISPTLAGASKLSGDCTPKIVVSGSLHGFSHGTHKHFNEILPKKLGLLRRLTPKECERLQGFPDDWTKYGLMNGKKFLMSDTQRYKMCGNAVTTNVIKNIIERMFHGSSS